MLQFEDFSYDELQLLLAWLRKCPQDADTQTSHVISKLAVLIEQRSETVKFIEWK